MLYLFHHDKKYVCKSDHNLPLLRILQCLLISLRGKATKASQFPLRPYIVDLTLTYEASHSLCSSHTGHFDVP